MKTVPLFVALAITLFASSGQAAVIGFADPSGDHTGAIDVTDMTLDVNETTGDYSIDFTATAANPFTGQFRINVNLFNVTLDEFFQDAFNDFDLGATTQTLFTLNGNSGDLTDWRPVHVIAASTLEGLGNPAGSSFFRTSVSNLPFRSVCVAEDVIGVAGCTPPAAGVPEPGTNAMLTLALAGLLAYGWKRVG